MYLKSNIYFVIKLYMFRASVPIMRSYLLYAWHLVRFIQAMWPRPSRDRLELWVVGIECLVLSPIHFSAQEKSPSTHFIGSWVCARTSLDAVPKWKITTSCRNQTSILLSFSPYIFTEMLGSIFSITRVLFQFPFTYYYRHYKVLT